MLIRRSILLTLNFLVFAVLFGYVVYPSLAGVAASLRSDQGDFTPDNYIRFFTESSALRAGLNTLLLAFASVAACGITGVLLAYIFWRFEFRLKSALLQLFILPLGLPPLVGVFSFQALYSESGIVTRSLQLALGWEQPPFVFTGFFAVLAVHTYSFYVHFFLFGYAALTRVDYALIEAASNLGASRFSALVKVLFPQLRPALYAAALIVFILSAASFTAPFLFADRMPFLTVEMYQQKLDNHPGMANAMSVVLIAVSLGLLYLFEQKQPPRSPLTRGAARSVKSERLSSRPVFLVLLGAMLLFTLLPVATLVLLSLAESPSAPADIFPTEFGAENYVKIFTDDSFTQPFFNSLSMAVLASVPNLVFGVVAGILLVQRTLGGRTLMSLLLLLPLAIPGTALAINLIAAFTYPSPLTFGQPLVGSYAILPLAYFIRNLPYIARNVSASLSTFDYALTEAAANLGASYIRVIGRVIVPIILASIASGFLLTFINAMGEFVSSIMLYTPDSKPVSVDIYSNLRLNDVGVAAAEGVLLMLFIYSLTSLASLIFRASTAPADL